MNWIDWAVPRFTGLLTGLVLAAWDRAGVMVQTLLVLMALDVLGGVIAAGIGGKLDSRAGFRGILKKTYVVLLVLAVAYVQGRLPITDSIPLADGVAGAFAAMELLSLLERGLVIGIKYPEVVKKMLAKYRQSVSGDQS